MIQDYRYLSVEILFQLESKNFRLDSIRKKYFSDLSLHQKNIARISMLTNHVTRLRGRLDHIIEYVSGKKIRQIDSRLRCILHIAVYETLFDKRVPEYAAVNSAVDITKNLLNRKAASFVNAILRKMLRLNQCHPTWLKALTKKSKWCSMPRWIMKKWSKRFKSGELKSLIAAMNESPPIHIRFNPNKIHLEEVINCFKKNNIKTNIIDTISYFLRVDCGAGMVMSTELFQKGFISIQDPASGAVVELLNPIEGDIILDVCAAPGTKSLFIAEKLSINNTIFASDIDLERVKMGKSDVRRHQKENINWSIADARTHIFHNADKILIDAPCSGTGVLARKPDIRWRRDKKDIDQFVTLQLDLLNHVSRYLKCNGDLVYATCSIEEEENWSVVKRFLNLNTNFKLVPGHTHLPQSWINDKGCLETFPHLHGVDGMFAAKIKRVW